MTSPIEEVHALLGRQTHWRFVEAHTPLDAIPMRDEVRHVCVGRDPGDAALSMLYHSEKMNRERFAELLGSPTAPAHALTAEQRIDRWIGGGGYPGWSARFLFHHYRTFWERRHAPNVRLFHFSDYQRVLPAELIRLAAHLDIEITGPRSVAG